MNLLQSSLAIGAGAAIGANLRWLLGLALNTVWPTIPLGTLAANWLGAWLIGIFMAIVLSMPDLSLYWRLFFVTGFLGALTTFSSFSSEMYTLIEAEQWLAAAVGVAAHVVGSLALVGLGMATFHAASRLLSFD